MCLRLPGCPVQAMTGSCLAQAYPWVPDLLCIFNCMAEEAGDPPASELLAMGYHAAVGLKPEPAPPGEVPQGTAA